MEKVFKAKCKGVKKKRILVKSKRNISDLSNDNKLIKLEKIIKSESKEENGTENENGNVIKKERIT